MSDVSVGSQIFDLVFHPSNTTVYTALLSGKVKAFAYNQYGRSKEVFSIKLSQKSCRGIALSEDGGRLYIVGKGKGLHTVDTVTGKLVESRAKAHETAINRVKSVTSWLISTGDDGGVVKLWDPRKKESIRKYTHHFDYITDFLWLEDKKHLVTTSGDGTLSVIDVRAKTSEPFAQSEDQEDELLSIVPIKGGTKVVVGTQLGILSVFNRGSGWGDCVDRIPGHPHSVDALCALPASLPNADHTSTILTGSSDGFVRAVGIFPTKLQGVVADHGEWPVERIAIGEGLNQLTLDENEGESADAENHSNASKINGQINTADTDDGENESEQGHYWVGSAGHDELLKLTNLGNFFNGETREEEVDERQDDDQAGLPSLDDELTETAGQPDNPMPPQHLNVVETSRKDPDTDSDAELEPTKYKKRKKKEKDPLSSKRKKGRNEVEVEGAFFAEL
ncbi:WD40-repeat-containing domain protein [Lentinula aciculospora]|uniref:WD repeat-containing protein JIP5 n=1 Tax=Lentinula aciculospora TaxID=153920 RepID=A0A9W9AT97_9AGAR|nr:WD40-repeat-containing domain protein [Lentinula aciculospora]